MSVLLNTGNLTFAPKVDYLVGNSPESIAVADVNGDGKLDLAIANASSNTVSVLFNNGNGTFAPKADYPAGDGSGARAPRPRPPWISTRRRRSWPWPSPAVAEGC